MFLGKNFSNTLQKHLKHLLSFQLSSPTFGPRTWHPPFHKKTLRPPKEVNSHLWRQLPKPEFFVEVGKHQFSAACWVWVASPHHYHGSTCKKKICADGCCKQITELYCQTCVCVSCLGMIRRFFQNRFALNGKSSDLFLSECTFCQTCHGIP